MDKPESPLLSTRQAAEILGLSSGTLENWRSAGVGPPWRRIGSKTIRYLKSELIAWTEGPGGQP